jgi:ABC-type bacteriocin/lantibiotic exporter with double-glycine peptidase domain
MQMHTFVSDQTLSGGQLQKLLIARALVTRPRILLFDEATSALDEVSQAHVSRSLEERSVTRIVIAHRLSTVRAAKRIHVLEGGQIVQTGRFDELAAEEGPFRELVRRQLLEDPAGNGGEE